MKRGWKKRIIAAQVHNAAVPASRVWNSPEAMPDAITDPMTPVMNSIWALQTSQFSSIAQARHGASLAIGGRLSCLFDLTLQPSGHAGVDRLLGVEKAVSSCRAHSQ